MDILPTPGQQKKTLKEVKELLSRVLPSSRPGLLIAYDDARRQILMNQFYVDIFLRLSHYPVDRIFLRMEYTWPTIQIREAPSITDLSEDNILSFMFVTPTGSFYESKINLFSTGFL